MNESSLDAINKVQKLIELMALGRSEDISPEEISALNSLIMRLKDPQLEKTVEKAILTNVFSGLGD